MSAITQPVFEEIEPLSSFCFELMGSPEHAEQAAEGMLNLRSAAGHLRFPTSRATGITLSVLAHLLDRLMSLPYSQTASQTIVHTKALECYALLAPEVDDEELLTLVIDQMARWLESEPTCGQVIPNLLVPMLHQHPEHPGLLDLYNRVLAGTLPSEAGDRQAVWNAIFSLLVLPTVASGELIELLRRGFAAATQSSALAYLYFIVIKHLYATGRLRAEEWSGLRPSPEELLLNNPDSFVSGQEQLELQRWIEAITAIINQAAGVDPA